MRSGGRLRRLRKPALALATLAVLLAGWAIVYHRYVGSLRGHDFFAEGASGVTPFSRLSAEDLVLLGHAQWEGEAPRSSYLRFPEDKPPGVRRIGVFGCSMVWGTEAGEGFDFPTLLGEELARRGYRGIEVINFGVGGYGMHQSVLLWERLGKRFDLDVVLFNLYAFHEQRDDTFVQLDGTSGPVHARYVLDGDGVGLIPPVGKTRAEASRGYYRIFPPWQYLRYDRKAPVFVRPLWSMGRSPRRNPFYYRPGDEDEIQETYVRLFSGFGGGSPRLVLVCNDEAICRFREWGRLGGVQFLRGEAADRTWTFPSLYRAPRNHLSALGNGLCALEIASFLAGQERASFLMARLDLEGGPPLGDFVPATRPISDWREAFLSVDGRAAASFVESDAEEKGTFRELDLPEAGVASLLDFSTPEELRFAGLPVALVDGEVLSLGLRAAGKEIRVPFGVVHSPSGVVGWASGSPPPPGVECIRFRAERPLGGLRVDRDARVVPLCLSLRGRDILRAREVERSDEGISYDFVPVDAPAIRVRATAGQTVDLDRIGERATIDLTLRDASGDAVVVPLAWIEPVSVETAPFDPPFAWPLRKE